MPTYLSVVVGLALVLAAAVTHADVVLQADATPYRPPEPPVSKPSPMPAIVEVWVDLTLPPTASLPRAERDERAALLRRIVAQQDQVMEQLALLGAVERARVQHVRNALAVRIPSTALERARAIPGVRAVSLVRHLQRNTR